MCDQSKFFWTLLKITVKFLRKNSRHFMEKKIFLILKDILCKVLWLKRTKDFGKVSSFAAQNAVIAPNFLVWKCCGKAHFPHSFERFARNCAETVPFRKISTPVN